jgi:anti-sigma factor RsiW
MIDAEKLNALIDDELEPAERAEVEAALAKDSRASHEASSLRQLKSAVQEHVRPVDCADEWKRCIGRLDEIDRAKKTRAFVDRYAWLMCTGLFAFIIVTGLLNRNQPGVRAGTGDLARATVGNPLHDASRVYTWVRNQFGRAPSIPQEKLHTVGWKQGTFSGRPVAQIELRDSRGALNLFVVPGTVVVEGVTPMDDGRHFAGTNGDGNCVAWSENGLAMVLTGKREATELREIADTIRVAP